jgi:proteasome lid subunit RPN8/RPN11
VTGAVQIPAAVLDDVVAHARETLPDECCGLLVGEPASVVRAVRARNLTPSPRRYLIDPADHFAAIRDARADGLAVVGAYHSHPGAPSEPSRQDLAEALFPDFLYLIVSIGPAGEPADARAYRLKSGQALRVDIART